MKKSTLITTIAMIVVVVVALSTATYAWFSSNTTAVATTSITTTAAGDWTMTQGTLAMPAQAEEPTASATATFTSGAVDSIQFTASMNQGLFAPTATVATAVSSAATAEITGIPTFYNASVTGNNTYQKAIFDGVSGEGHNAYKAPIVIKLANAQSSPKSLKLTVVVNAGPSTDNTATLYAAAATSFYAAWNKVGTGAGVTAGSATNGYSYHAAATASGDAYIAQTALDGAATPVSGGTLVRPTYDTVAPSNFAQCGAQGDISVADGPKYGLAENDYYLSYDVVIGEVPVGGAVYVLLYTWIDGWEAETNAAGASYSINFAFTTGV